MSQLSIPSLSLFNRSPRKQRTSSQFMLPTHDHSLYQATKQTSFIQKQPYLPEVIPNNDQIGRLRRCQIELEYLNAYKDALRRQELSQVQGQTVPNPYLSAQPYHSYQTSHRGSLLSFRDRKNHKECQCELGPSTMLAKNAYLLKPQLPKYRPPSPTKGEAGVIINKSPYLIRPADNIKKGYVQQQKPMQIDKSIMINNSLKGPIAQAEIQTDEPNLARSSFLISTVIQKEPQMMNQKNFRKTIKGLKDHIHSLSLDLNSEDFIIDLNDLLQTKRSYPEIQSNIQKSLMKYWENYIVCLQVNQFQVATNKTMALCCGQKESDFSVQKSH